MSKSFPTPPSTPFPSSYINPYYLKTKNHTQNHPKDSLNLSTKTSPSKPFNHTLNHTPQSKPLSNKSFHTALRTKSAKRVYNNFLRNFFSANLQLDIAKARQPNILLQTIQSKHNEFNTSLPYKEYSPVKKKFVPYYNIATNKKDTFVHSTHPTIQTTKPIKQKPHNMKAHQREYLNGIGYLQLYRIHERKRRELNKGKGSNKRMMVVNKSNKNELSLEQKRKEDVKRFYLSML